MTASSTASISSISFLASRKNPNATTMNGLSGEPSVDLGFETMSSGVSRRDFLTVSLAAAALLALSGCALFHGSKSDLDRATTDLRKLLESFEGDGARHARLASIGRTIEVRCREGIELTPDVNQRVHALSRRRETPSSELTALEVNYSVRRAKYREEILVVQEELRRALTKEEWEEVFGGGYPVRKKKLELPPMWRRTLTGAFQRWTRSWNKLRDIIEVSSIFIANYFGYLLVTRNRFNPQNPISGLGWYIAIRLIHDGQTVFQRMPRSPRTL